MSRLDAPVVEYQTCERGPGFDLKAAASGVYGAHFQYGVGMVEAPYTLTVTPKLGVGFLDHAVPELSTTTNFSLGLQALMGYGNARVGLEYWHLSNAGLGSVNAGLDMLVLQAGWVF